MKSKQVTQHKCDFCSKKLYAKGAMARHEKFCIANPVNTPACYKECKHLVIEKVDEGGDSYTQFVKTPRCMALDVYMHNSIAVKKGLLKKYPSHFEGSMLMPLVCEHFQHNMDYAQLEENPFT